jgi:hypothetical protein
LNGERVAFTGSEYALSRIHAALVGRQADFRAAQLTSSERRKADG